MRVFDGAKRVQTAALFLILYHTNLCHIKLLEPCQTEYGGIIVVVVYSNTVVNQHHRITIIIIPYNTIPHSPTLLLYYMIIFSSQ